VNCPHPTREPRAAPLCSAELRSSGLDPSQLILEQQRHMADKGARDANGACTSTLVGWYMCRQGTSDVSLTWDAWEARAPPTQDTGEGGASIRVHEEPLVVLEHGKAGGIGAGMRRMTSRRW
jgi:hypothetical protein